MEFKKANNCTFYTQKILLFHKLVLNNTLNVIGGGGSFL